MRRGARWALGIGASLIAMAAVSGACADVCSINLDECSGICIAPATDDVAAAEDESAADITLSLFGGGTEDANDARPDLTLDAKALPPVLVGGLPSPIASAGAQAPDGRGISPYAFFEDIIDIQLPIDARTGLSAASILLFTPSLIGRLTLTDVLSNSNDLFKFKRPPPRPAM
ncbi:MAG TPA: hypothetical protein VGL12_05210 [Roseiarcus sp.]